MPLERYYLHIYYPVKSSLLRFSFEAILLRLENWPISTCIFPVCVILVPCVEMQFNFDKSPPTTEQYCFCTITGITTSEPEDLYCGNLFVFRENELLAHSCLCLRGKLSESLMHSIVLQKIPSAGGLDATVEQLQAGFVQLPFMLAQDIFPKLNRPSFQQVRSVFLLPLIGYEMLQTISIASSEVSTI